MATTAMTTTTIVVMMMTTMTTTMMMATIDEAQAAANNRQTHAHTAGPACITSAHGACRAPGMPASDPSSWLLQKAREGDARALGEIHDRFYAPLYRYALFRLGDHALAEDIASEVFLRFLDTLQSDHPPHTTLQGWLFAVAGHVVVDHIRRAPRERAPVSEALGSGHSTEAEAEARLLRDRVRAAIRRLTLDQQQVLTLRFADDFSSAQTAEIMNKTVNAVKVLQFRATAALRRALGGIGEGG
jgi:RNA polymerase sigma-70 factor (ECF subfamily)